MQLFRAIALHPSFLEIMCSKKIICFLKTRLFKKHDLFNNLNQQRKSLLPLVSNNIDLRIFPFFIKKHDLKNAFV